MCAATQHIISLKSAAGHSKTKTRWLNLSGLTFISYLFHEERIRIKIVKMISKIIVILMEYFKYPKVLNCEHRLIVPIKSNSVATFDRLHERLSCYSKPKSFFKCYDMCMSKNLELIGYSILPSYNIQGLDIILGMSLIY